MADAKKDKKDGLNWTQFFRPRHTRVDNLKKKDESKWQEIRNLWGK